MVFLKKNKIRKKGRHEEIGKEWEQGPKQAV